MINWRNKDDNKNKKEDIEENRKHSDGEILKVAAKTNPNSLAGAIANTFRENDMVELQAVGAGAINQAVKAIAISRGYVAPSGVDLVCIPGFEDIEIDGEERTAIKFIVLHNS